jgi:hypothetical protein
LDVTQALSDTENALRDFIAAVLRNKFGPAWEPKCGVSDERLEAWRSRKREGEKQHRSGAADDRLMYYADFYDLKTILKKHWSGEFSQVFGDWKTMEVWLDSLGRLRNSDAHRRELLPHQKHLILGIAGDIRTHMMSYRSKQETNDDCYPRLEHVADSLGSIWQYGTNNHWSIIDTKRCLRVGDRVDFVIAASDPLGAELAYAVRTIHGSYDSGWQEANSLSIQFCEADIRKLCDVQLRIRSPRKYHALGEYDDLATFRYSVLPPKE